MSAAAVTVVGAGLAGAEAAYQLARQNIKVLLLDMKPAQYTAAHQSPFFGELVCSNSLRSSKLENAAGLLKTEMKAYDSLILKAAAQTQVPAGASLAVDRSAFPKLVSQLLAAEPNISIEQAELKSLEQIQTAYKIIATGPLTTAALLLSIQQHVGIESLFFFDAAAPLIYADSIADARVFRANRYQKDGGDYLNCPLNKAEYDLFYERLLTADKAHLHDFDKKFLFSGCQAIEAIAAEGYDTMRFGPLKPVGLPDPRTGAEAYAVVQLRQDNFAASLWNMVGFQSRLTFAAQKEVFRLIPGLEQAEFARFGVMHRNSFLCSPAVLTFPYHSKKDASFFFAGQITGVEGYLESAASGLLVGRYLASRLGGEELPPALQSRSTVIGALAHYVSAASSHNFQPMKANFGILAPLTKTEISTLKHDFALSMRGRRAKRLFYALRSLKELGLRETEIKELVRANVAENDKGES